jgi:hypothetical protein
MRVRDSLRVAVNAVMSAEGNSTVITDDDAKQERAEGR